MTKYCGTFVLCALGLLFSGGARADAARAGCARKGALEFVCGPRNVEDLVRLPGRDVLIGSGYAGDGPAPGQLYAIETRNRTAEVLKLEVGKPDRPYASCPGALDVALFHPHGIALRSLGDDRALLYVVNHGGRESIELFSVNTRTVALKWVGCVVLPDGTSGNGVAPLPDGGFVATKFYDTHAGNWVAQLIEGKRTGTAFEWHPATGFKEISGVVASGDYGLDTSADGRWLFVDLWPEKRIMRVDLSGAQNPQSIGMDFMPDNIHRAPDGTLLVGGHISDMKTLMACKRERCPVDWAVARIDPGTLAVTYLLWEKGTPQFEGVTGAVELGDRLWFSVFRGERVGSVSLPVAPLR